jgi:hypothetical protein
MKKELLAPNGKPSNLTAEQYKLVRTPEFKKWFGDWENEPEIASKVVDSNGEPLVVYHGTGYDFNEFKAKYDNRGIALNFFTDSKKTALQYGSKIKSLFLKINELNVIDGNSRGFNDVYDQTMLSTEFRNLNNSYEEDFEGLIIYDIYDHPTGKKKGNKSNVYVVKYPNQIKLADGTNTTFDSKNNDIRYNKGGITESGTPDYLKFLIG